MALLQATVLYRYPQRSRSQKQCENQSVPVIIKHLIPRWNSDPLVNTENGYFSSLLPRSRTRNQENESYQRAYLLVAGPVDESKCTT